MSSRWYSGTGHFTVIKGPSSGRRWIRGESIGRGSLGTVYQAMDQQTGELLAVKEVVINASDSADMKFKDQLENEIQIVKELKHPRIVAYLGHDYMGDSLFIYLEFMAGGSLAQALNQFGCFEEPLLLAYTKEMLEGLQYLHNRETPVVHRDIKGANVLVDLDCHAKLSDFGCSKRSNDTMPPPQSPPSPQSGRMWQGLVGCMLARGPRVKVLHITMGGLPFSVRVLSPIRDAGPLRGAPLKRQEAEDTTSWSWVCAMMPSGRLSPRFHLRRGRG
ncbi:ANP3 [Symbiodinium natans]|uniref:ANP3 protein n=1 Tax=Symbiodinium natans TaxID=878477 RepID=A0A812HC06_9DINO|nr:ANP3 [Symbiodinium natans]